MASQLAQGQLRTPEFAEAHAARAEVLLRQRRFADALPEFEKADIHAHVARYIEREISSRALWAKARMLADDEPLRHDLALHDVDGARPLLASVAPLERQMRLEAELEDAAGYVEYQRDNYPEARRHHERAIELLAKLELPVQLARSLNNLGAALQMLGQSDEALTTYKRAREVLDAAGVPIGHSTSIEVELDVGNLMIDLDRSEGFDHFATVVRYTSGERQLKALRLALTLANNLSDKDRMRELADDILPRISSGPLTSAEEVDAQFNVAAALVQLGDPRGDGLFDALEQLPPELSAPELRLNWRRSRVTSLELAGRCDDAAKVLADLDVYARQHSLADETFLEWRPAFESGDCRLGPLSNP